MLAALPYGALSKKIFNLCSAIPTDGKALNKQKCGELPFMVVSFQTQTLEKQEFDS
jgi:hypothetical protein